jgi:precorrin-6B methylase 2
MSGPPEGLIGQDGYDWMAEQAKDMASVVEVGCWQGYGTEALLRVCPGQVTAVDHWMGSPDPTDATHKPAKKYDIHALFVARVGHYPNLTILRMDSVEASTHFPDQSVDMIFIDAGHDAASVTADIRAWAPKCRKLICGHDGSYETVRKAVETLGRPINRHPGDIWSVRCDG